MRPLGAPAWSRIRAVPAVLSSSTSLTTTPAVVGPTASARRSRSLIRMSSRSRSSPSVAHCSRPRAPLTARPVGSKKRPPLSDLADVLLSSPPLARRVRRLSGADEGGVRRRSTRGPPWSSGHGSYLSREASVRTVAASTRLRRSRTAPAGSTHKSQGGPHGHHHGSRHRGVASRARRHPRRRQRPRRRPGARREGSRSRSRCAGCSSRSSSDP